MITRNFWLLAVALQAVVCQAHIIQRNSIKSVLDEIQDERTLVVFDIDETLIYSSRYGSTAQLTEKEVLEVIAQVKKRTNKGHGGCIALTARRWNPKTVEFTSKQFADLGISFKDHTSLSSSFSFSCELAPAFLAAGYQDGVMYVGHNGKGTFLVFFLMLQNLKPSKVVFIDDHLPFIKEVDEQLTKFQVPHVCIHYVPTPLT